MAPHGHSGSQFPQPMQSSVILLAMSYSLSRDAKAGNGTSSRRWDAMKTDQALAIASTGQAPMQADAPPVAAHSSHRFSSMT